MIGRNGLCAFPGEMGLARFERGLAPDFDDWPEAGWGAGAVHMARAAIRGYPRVDGGAAVAGHCVLKWMFARGDLQGAVPRIVCMIAEGPRSQHG